MSRPRRVLLIVFAVLVFVGIGAAIDAFWIEPGRLVVRHAELALPRWPHALDGLKIALLSDLHTGSPHNGIDNLRRVVDETNAQRPDLVLLAGDYVIHGVVGGTFTPPEAIAQALGLLKPTIGTFAVLGNHDWWFDAERITAALEAHGVTVVDDRAARVDWRGETFFVVGISDFWEGRHDVEGALAPVPADAPTLALTHNPDILPRIPSRVALTMAGHTHGGQVNLPVFGRMIVPSAPRYAIGHVVEEGKHLFVTSGIGTSILPVRFRVAPEIAVLVLRSEH